MISLNKYHRAALRIVILLATAAAFAYYLSGHAELVHQLLRIPVSVLCTLLGLYIVWFAALALTVHATLRLCGCPLRFGEHILLNAWSTLVNFFVPGQGGLAMRGLYLKNRHGLGLRRYVSASLVYYACYAMLSVFMLLVASRPWWQTVLGLAVAAMASAVAVKWYLRRNVARQEGLELHASNLVFLLLATAAQALVQVGVYAYELRNVQPGISLTQAMTYTGAANLSLFVALTPGAIGIRESFLLLSRSLHHVSTQVIVAASVLDRAVFLLLLGLLFLMALIFHARRTLRVEQE